MCGSRTPSRLRLGPFRIINRFMVFPLQVGLLGAAATSTPRYRSRAAAPRNRWRVRTPRILNRFTFQTAARFARHGFAISPRNPREFYPERPATLTSEGEGNAGRPLRPQPRARNKTKHDELVTTVTPEITRHSPRNGFTAYFVLSPAIGLVCHRRLRFFSQT